MSLFSVGIIGYRGYSGAELVRLLRRHPGVKTVLLEHREDGGAEGALPATPEAIREAGLALVFLATPPEVALELTPALLATGAKVIDLSGAFRLGTPERYAEWYGAAHTAPGLLAEAAYGLPEFYRESIRPARLVSNPGCYPTAANLAIRPLLDAGIVERSAGVICDAKSGVSGAGRKPSLKTSFCEVTENFSAYAVLKHRHVPEVLMNSGLKPEEFNFTAQLIPIERGILETIYVRVHGVQSAGDILALYRDRYHGDPFVRVHAAGSQPDLRGVARTNLCALGVTFDSVSRRAVIVSAIDNLGKGAAGQAIQNMNLVLGFAESECLV